uniref:Uncharacterized protein n=1 Tax=Aegilops tauschii TaxID=37682 RepID=M8AWH5_AEGTA
MVPGEVARICGHSEIADELTEIIGTRVRFYARVDTVDGERGLVVFSLHFVGAEPPTNTSLPRHCPAVYDKRPLLVRHDDGCYSLVLMAISSQQWTDDPLVRPVICPWSPPTPQSLSRDDHDKGDGVCAWKTRQGKAFWADLKQGVLYCDCADHLNDGDDDMEFTYVALPEEYGVEELNYNGRAMGGGVGDIVWFVVIESYEHPGDTTVVVWSLDLSDGAERRWERHRELSLLSIWAMQGFVEAGLPRRVPWSPFLREQDAGVLYFLLPLADEKSARGCHLIGIDLNVEAP